MRGQATPAPDANTRRPTACRRLCFGAECLRCLPFSSAADVSASRLGRVIPFADRAVGVNPSDRADGSIHDERAMHLEVAAHHQRTIHGERAVKCLLPPPFPQERDSPGGDLQPFRSERPVNQYIPGDGERASHGHRPMDHERTTNGFGIRQN